MHICAYEALGAHIDFPHNIACPASHLSDKRDANNESHVVSPYILQSRTAMCGLLYTGFKRF